MAGRWQSGPLLRSAGTAPQPAPAREASALRLSVAFPRSSMQGQWGSDTYLSE